MTDKYDDIINLPYKKSIRRKHMSLEDRAAQFGAFKPLRGHEEELEETARLTSKKTVLDEYETENLNTKLKYLLKHLSKRPIVKITYFVPDDKKDGGEYIDFNGIIKKIKSYEQVLITENNDIIPINDILTIDSNIFNTNEVIYENQEY